MILIRNVSRSSRHDNFSSNKIRSIYGPRLHCLTCFSLHRSSVERVGRVVKHTASATHLHRGVIARAGSAVLGSGVSAAHLLLVVVSGQLDVALLAPGRGPRVAHQPVLLAALLAVAHQ